MRIDDSYPIVSALRAMHLQPRASLAAANSFFSR
jgi:hypothetical protein